MKFVVLSGNMDDLIKRYCKTGKGRHIIVTSMWNPVKLCRMVYKNGELHYRVGDKTLNLQEAEAWRAEQQKIHRDKCIKLYCLTEDDFELSEEKLEKIVQDETIGRIRNIGLVGDDSEELKEAILNCIPKIVNLHEIGSG